MRGEIIRDIHGIVRRSWKIETVSSIPHRFAWNTSNCCPICEGTSRITTWKIWILKLHHQSLHKNYCNWYVWLRRCCWSLDEINKYFGSRRYTRYIYTYIWTLLKVRNLGTLNRSIHNENLQNFVCLVLVDLSKDHVICFAFTWNCKVLEYWCYINIWREW